MRDRYFINHQDYSKEGVLTYVTSHLKNPELLDWEHDLYIFIQKWFSDEDSISICTSGSTGDPKEISISKKLMVRSALRTLHYFDVQPYENMLLCLPVKYIAGLMMVVRSFVGHCNLITISPQHLKLGSKKEKFGFASMVPLQIEKLLEGNQDLGSISKLILGGSPVSYALEEKLKQSYKGQVWETYGMTETLTHVAVRKITGEPKVFHALPDISFSVDDRQCLVITDTLIQAQPIITNDLVELISPTSFRLLGRLDFVINSGGIKVHTEEVENSLRPYITGKFCITSIPDNILGEAVVLVVESGADLDRINEGISTLSGYMRPKKVIELQYFPVNSNGKVDYRQIRTLMNWS